MLNKNREGNPINHSIGIHRQKYIMAFLIVLLCAIIQLSLHATTNERGRVQDIQATVIRSVSENAEERTGSRSAARAEKPSNNSKKGTKQVSNV